MTRYPIAHRAATLLGLAWTAASFLPACSSGTEPAPVDPTSSASEALGGVVACQVAARKCHASADAASDERACDSEFRSCLETLFAAAGASPFRSHDDGGPSLPSVDAGLVNPVLQDAAPIPASSADGGMAPPPVTDAGSPPTSAPGDGGATTDAQCRDALHACLTSQAAPMQCADQARTCFSAVIRVQCDACQQSCLDSGAPQSVCVAKRQSCR
jgi:hypothetical protein